MSIKHRKPGDLVRLRPYSGYMKHSDRLLAEIQFQEEENDPCMVCDDPECIEWATLWTEPDPENDGKRYALYHVSECQMFDVKK